MLSLDFVDGKVPSGCIDWSRHLLASRHALFPPLMAGAPINRHGGMLRLQASWVGQYEGSFPFKSILFSADRYTGSEARGLLLVLVPSNTCAPEGKSTRARTVRCSPSLCAAAPGEFSHGEMGVSRAEDDAGRILQPWWSRVEEALRGPCTSQVACSALLSWHRYTSSSTWNQEEKRVLRNIGVREVDT
eukprot:444452-Pelagomonas_calceolata.AAC.2